MLIYGTCMDPKLRIRSGQDMHYVTATWTLWEFEAPKYHEPHRIQSLQAKRTRVRLSQAATTPISGIRELCASPRVCCVLDFLLPCKQNRCRYVRTCRICIQSASVRQCIIHTIYVCVCICIFIHLFAKIYKV